MWEDHLRGVLVFDELLQGESEAVGGVLGEEGVLDAKDFGDGVGGDLGG